MHRPRVVHSRRRRLRWSNSLPCDRWIDSRMATRWLRAEGSGPLVVRPRRGLPTRLADGRVGAIRRLTLPSQWSGGDAQCLGRCLSHGTFHSLYPCISVAGCSRCPLTRKPNPLLELAQVERSAPRAVLALVSARDFATPSAKRVMGAARPVWAAAARISSTPTPADQWQLDIGAITLAPSYPLGRGKQRSAAAEAENARSSVRTSLLSGRRPSRGGARLGSPLESSPYTRSIIRSFASSVVLFIS
jgi:hypothetical protein